MFLTFFDRGNLVVKINKKQITIIILVLLVAISMFVVYTSNDEPSEEGEKEKEEEKSSEMNADDMFDNELAYQHIEKLSSDEFEGRRAGTKGNEKAYNFIANKFEKYNLEPAGDDDTYFQYYKQQSLKYNSPITLEIIDDKKEIETLERSLLCGKKPKYENTFNNEYLGNITYRQYVNMSMSKL